jgi:hypothetical protein
MKAYEDAQKSTLPESRTLTRNERSLVDEGLVDGTGSQVGAAVLREDRRGGLGGLGS